jgi:hypothetical protein
MSEAVFQDLKRLIDLPFLVLLYPNHHDDENSRCVTFSSPLLSSLLLYSRIAPNYLHLSPRVNGLFLSTGTFRPPRLNSTVDLYRVGYLNITLRRRSESYERKVDVSS